MHAHPGALAILAAFSCATLPDKGRQRSTATHVSTWLMASGHVHALKRNFSKRLRFGGGTYGLISQTNYWCCLYRYCLAQRLNTTIWASKCERGRKTLLTLEKCGEPGSFEVWLQPLDRQ